MGLKAALSKPFAALVVKGIEKWKKNPIAAQQQVFRHLIDSAKDTAFGKDHNFAAVNPMKISRALYL
jgi:hypothetical protein